jgi:hypothetical protein
LLSTKNTTTFEDDTVPYEDITLKFYFRKPANNVGDQFSFKDVSIDENVGLDIGLNTYNSGYQLVNSFYNEFSFNFYLADSNWNNFYDYSQPILLKFTVPKFLKVDVEKKEKINFIESFLRTPLTVTEFNFFQNNIVEPNPGAGFYVPSVSSPGNYTNEDIFFNGNFASKQFLSSKAQAFSNPLSTPAFSFSGDRDTGFDSRSANSVNLVAGGVPVLRATGSSASLSLVDGQSGTIIDFVTQTKFLNAETSGLNPIPNRANQLSSGSTIYRNDTTSARTYGIAPYYKTLSSAGMTKSSTDHTWNLGYRRSIEMEFVRLNTGTMTITATSDLSDGTNTYRTRFAISGQASLATSFQVANLYDKVILTLVSYGESGTTRDIVWHVQGNISNVVLA